MNQAVFCLRRGGVYILVLTLILLTACSETIPPPTNQSNKSDNVADDTGAPNGFDTNVIYEYDGSLYSQADAMRGALLYDKWSSAAAGTAVQPDTAHWLWPSRAKNSQGQYYNQNSNSTSWRCKECHGWDYKGRDGAYGDKTNSHYTGFPSLLSAARFQTAKSIFEFIANGSSASYGNVRHGFAGILSRQNIYDLTKFIKDKAQDIYAIVPRGSISDGYTLFQAKNCGNSACHGPVGTLNEGVKVAVGNEQEFVHKTLFGSAGSNMPNGLLSLDEAFDVRVYLSTYGGQATIPPNIASAGGFVRSKYDSANATAGGLLYDNWLTEAKRALPVQNSWLWSKRAKSIAGNYYNARSGDDSWRCKECHGWDYKGVQGDYGSTTNSHYTGFKGVLDAANAGDAQTVYNFIAYGRDSRKNLHGFSSLLTESEIYNLTRFIVEDIKKLININFNTGNASAGQVLYDTTCKQCHGTDGSIDNAALVAKENPAEFLHKVVNGQPGVTAMPTVTNIQDVLNIRAFLAGTTGNTPQDPPTTSQFSGTLYANADLVRGGRLYDKWWNEKAVAAPATDHPLWQNRVKNADGTFINPRGGADSWRCKECHGWDYAGKDGAYASGSHRTDFPGVLTGTGTRINAQGIFDFLATDANHSYGVDSKLSETDLYDLTRFVEEMRTSNYNANNYIDADKQIKISAVQTQTALSSAAKGETFYNQTSFDAKATCVSCHGANGVLSADEPIAEIAKDNPWELLHKIRFGQPGAPTMPALHEASYSQNNQTQTTSMQEVIDLAAFAQTWLNPDLKRGGRLFDKWYQEKTAQQSNFAAPTVDHAKWPTRARNPVDNSYYNAASGAGTWRCKECHGWDYQGRDGAYGTGSSHYTNFPGIFTTALTRDGIFQKIQGTGGNDHSFGGNITVASTSVKGLNIWDLADLSSFILDEVAGINVTPYTTNGNSTSGNTLYNQRDDLNVNGSGNCQFCHGAKGTVIPTVDVNAIAVANPQEFLHKSRFGNPYIESSQMIPGNPDSGYRGLSLQQAADVLAFSLTLSTLPDTPDTPTGNASYDQADITRGGRLYDKWWAEMAVLDSTAQEPTMINPLWLAKDPNVNVTIGTPSDSWRCKTCHTWAYVGIKFSVDNFGQVANDNLLNIRSSHPSLSELQLQNYVFRWIKDGNGRSVHKYGVSQPTIGNPTALSDRDVWDLTKFVLEGVTNTSAYISSLDLPGTQVQYDITPDEKTLIQAQNDGALLYSGNTIATINCESCHGANGIAAPPGSAESVDIFSLSDRNPWEVFHKIRFGQPGSNMPSLLGIAGKTRIEVERDARDIIGHMQNQNRLRIITINDDD